MLLPPSAAQLLRDATGRCDGDVHYGVASALAAASGLLFLAAGQASLSRSNEAVAALLALAEPHWAHSTGMNNYWPQAARHLGALAVDARSLHALDVDSQVRPAAFSLRCWEGSSRYPPLRARSRP